MHTLLGYIGKSGYLIEPSRLGESMETEVGEWDPEDLSRRKEESIRWLAEALEEA